MTTTYFAYGTLLDEAAMLGIAPSARSKGIYRLDGYRMEFGRCARPDATGCTLEADPAAVTYGILYELSEEDMDKLDGAAVAGAEMWVHLPVTLTDAQGRREEAVTYTIPGTPPQIAPSDDYVRPILKGLDTLSLPEAYVEDMKRIVEQAQNRA